MFFLKNKYLFLKKKKKKTFSPFFQKMIKINFSKLSPFKTKSFFKKYVFFFPKFPFKNKIQVQRYIFKTFPQNSVVKDLCYSSIPLNPQAPILLTLSLTFSLALMYFVCHPFFMIKMRKFWMKISRYSSNSLILLFYFFIFYVVVCLFIIASIHMLSIY